MARSDVKNGADVSTPASALAASDADRPTPTGPLISFAPSSDVERDPARAIRWVAAEATARREEAELMLAWMGFAPHPADSNLWMGEERKIANRARYGFDELERVGLLDVLTLGVVQADGLPPPSFGAALIPARTFLGRPKAPKSAAPEPVHALFQAVANGQGDLHAERLLVPTRMAGTSMPMMHRPGARTVYTPKAIAQFGAAEGLPVTLRLWFSTPFVPFGVPEGIRAIEDACATHDVRPGRLILELAAPPSSGATPPRAWLAEVESLRRFGFKLALRVDGPTDAKHLAWTRELRYDYLHLPSAPKGRAGAEQLMQALVDLTRPKTLVVLGGIASAEEMRWFDGDPSLLFYGEAVGPPRRELRG